VFIFLSVSLFSQQSSSPPEETVTLNALINNLQYSILKNLWTCTGQPGHGRTGILSGRILDENRKPIAGARLLVSLWNGKTFSAVSDDAGNYLIIDIPSGTYNPVAGAEGYEDSKLGGTFGISINADAETVMEVILPFENIPEVAPGENLDLGAARHIIVSTPVKAEALRRQLTFTCNDQTNLLTYVYTPVDAAKSDPLPVLLAVYPSSAKEWEQASIPLAASGYTVIAVGPSYRFDMDRDVEELGRIIDFIKADKVPHCDKKRIGVLGGSYSGIHVLRLLRHRHDFKAAILLGAPADLFEIRYRMEEGNFVPPFNLDKALISLGFPDREPLYYWRFSGAYHIDKHYPAILLMHSRSDEVVHFHQSEILANHLKQAGVPHEFYLFDNASHYLLSKHGDAPKLLEVTLKFLNDNLKQQDQPDDIRGVTKTNHLNSRIPKTQ